MEKFALSELMTLLFVLTAPTPSTDSHVGEQDEKVMRQGWP